MALPASLETVKLLLHFKEVGSGPPLVVLHGLLGSLNNWQSTARELSTQFRVILVDQRNHGRSFHSPQHSYSLLSGDIQALMDSLSLEKTSLMGHSMGGKTAMSFAARFPERIHRLIVVDIAPRAYRSGQDHLLDSLLSVNLKEVTSRAIADQILSRTVPDKRLRQFLLTNLRRGDQGQFFWKANLEVLRGNSNEITKGVEFPAVCKVPTLFIRGESSRYIDPSDVAHIRTLYADVSVKTIPGAGHWVHTDKPDLFVRTVRDFLGGDISP